MKTSLALLLLCFTSVLNATAALVWTNTTGGNWNVTANWTPNELPTVTDDVFITNSGTYAVTLNVASTDGMARSPWAAHRARIVIAFIVCMCSRSTRGSSIEFTI